MKRTGLLLALVVALSLIAAPALAAEGPTETGNSLPPDLIGERVYFAGCQSEYIFLQPQEPFHVRHGFVSSIGLAGVAHKVGTVGFTLAVNGIEQPSKIYNVVIHGDTGAPAISRWFVTEFPTGVSYGDVLAATWYDHDGVIAELYCEMTVLFG